MSWSSSASVLPSARPSVGLPCRSSRWCKTSLSCRAIRSHVTACPFAVYNITWYRVMTIQWTPCHITIAPHDITSQAMLWAVVDRFVCYRFMPTRVVACHVIWYHSTRHYIPCDGCVCYSRVLLLCLASPVACATRGVLSARAMRASPCSRRHISTCLINMCVIYIYIYIYIYICIYIYVYTHIYIYIYIERERERELCMRYPTHMYTYIYIYIHTDTHIYTYIYIYIYSEWWSRSSSTRDRLRRVRRRACQHPWGRLRKMLYCTILHYITVMYYNTL